MAQNIRVALMIRLHYLHNIQQMIWPEASCCWIINVMKKNKKFHEDEKSSYAWIDFEDFSHALNIEDAINIRYTDIYAVSVASINTLY